MAAAAAANAAAADAAAAADDAVRRHLPVPELGRWQDAGREAAS